MSRPNENPGETSSSSAPNRPSPATAVGAVIVHPNGSVLLARRGRPPRVGSWSLPGGKPWPDEPLEEAILREVREETGLEVRIARPLGTVLVAGDGYSYAIHEYLCHPIDPDAVPVAGDDASEVAWVALNGIEPFGVTAEVLALVTRALASEAITSPRAP